jgi:hypothetical protein
MRGSTALFYQQKYLVIANLDFLTHKIDMMESSWLALHPLVKVMQLRLDSGYAR